MDTFIYMRQKYAHIILSFLRTLTAVSVSFFMMASLTLAVPIWSQDSESFFDDELPDDSKKNSGDLKSKPIELKADDEEKKKPKKTDERGEVIRTADETPKATPKDEGPTEQVAPLAARPKETILDNSRFSVAGDYFFNSGRGTVNLPSGWGGFLAYDADESHGKGFDLRFEVGYLNITKSASSVNGFYAEAGLSWLFRLPKLPVQFSTAILPGVGYYNFKDANGSGSALKATAHAALGVEFPFLMKRADRTDEFIPFMQVRSGIIYDNVLPVVTYGVYVGMAYKFGAVIFKY